MSQLFLLDGTALQPFEAFDPDVKEFGNVTFAVNSESGDHEFFEIIKLNSKQSNLQITKTVAETTYNVSIPKISF